MRDQRTGYMHYDSYNHIQTYEYLRDRISPLSFSLRLLDAVNGTDLFEVLLSKECSDILVGTGENGYGEGMGFVDGSLYACSCASFVGWGVTNDTGSIID